MAKHDKRDQNAPERVSTPAASEVAFQAEAPGSTVTDEMLRNDGANPESWLHYNKGLEQTGYSPAARITPDNVGDITEEYTREKSGVQQNPIVVPSGDGDAPPVMYYPAGQNVTALNARTGDEYWTFEYSPEYGGGGRNRGVAVRGDYVYFCGADLRVVALDRYTGEQQWRTHAVSDRQLELMTPSTRRMTNTAAPLVFDGILLKGQSGEGGNWGAFVAMDAESGEKLWSYNVIPTDYWIDETWRFGDGSPWTTPSVDPESNTVLVPTGNPSPQINAAVRPGPNKHSDSVVALDAESGEEQWVHQFVANDWWDYDTYLTTVMDVEMDGESRRVVFVKDKTGWTYILDVETGQLLRRSVPHANQGAELPFMGVPPAGEENAKEKSPSAIGATDWHPDGYSPQTGLFYIGSNDDYRGSYYNPDWEFDENSLEHSIGGGKIHLENPESGEKATRSTAIDPSTGEIAWTQSFPQPAGWAGGHTPTAGNVVFVGNNGGVFRALDAENGDVLWETQTDQNFSASPVVWDDPSEGKQYVAIMSTSTLNVFSVEADSQGTDTAGGTETEDNSTQVVGGGNASGASMPGFGAVAGAVGVGGAAYAAKKNVDDEAGDDEAGDEDD